MPNSAAFSSIASLISFILIFWPSLFYLFEQENQ
ncbi:cytochrome c oxidase subunit 2A [archaeon]|nr:cytochrome c oxidase subunit 2A [archaeon]MBT6183073.1 cytochrome c oxidase subunit 2A [archaeon]MBT6606235.1 cytochrome c oxidase subunit 2A [archaeon]MBT7251596.1 cytochrome c oxidase subunit 2A [archaeon]MBT7660899.1 cytochrome c oxidase subunit 2A [archaeon]